MVKAVLWVGQRKSLGDDRYFSSQLHVEVLHVESVVFDKFTAGFNCVSHQNGKNLIRFDRVVDSYLEQGTLIRIHRSFP